MASFLLAGLGLALSPVLVFAAALIHLVHDDRRDRRSQRRRAAEVEGLRVAGRHRFTVLDGGAAPSASSRQDISA